MKVNTAFLFTASICYHVASALRIDSSESKYLSVASPETSQLQNFQNSNNDIPKDGDMFEKRADVQPSGEAPLDIRINDFFEHLKGFTIMVSEFGVANESPIALRLLFDRQLLRLRANLDALKSAILDEA
ncbi:hypothetical protein OXX79_000090 [Metschnikowia pulcherrima]